MNDPLRPPIAIDDEEGGNRMPFHHRQGFGTERPLADGHHAALGAERVLADGLRIPPQQLAHRQIDDRPAALEPAAQVAVGDDADELAARVDDAGMTRAAST